MTAGTGKRLYRACQRCRRRKTRCDLNSIGEPNKPPCLDCFRSGLQCGLAESNRGGDYSQYRAAKRRRAESIGDIVSNTSEGHQTPKPTSTYSQHAGRDQSPEPVTADLTNEALHAELRNPSDALQILAQSNNSNESVGPGDRGLDRMTTAANQSPKDRRVQTTSSETRGRTDSTSQQPFNERSAIQDIDEYELIERGLLRLAILPELLQIFARNYHPYFPIVPEYILAPSALEKIKKADFFLLTVILTIASRDQLDFCLTHRYCWDHTQSLLLDVLLAHPWTHTPRTVEGLLLLSEWLPHIQMRRISPGDGSKSPFLEDRTAWSLVGQAVRHAYSLRLDRTSFRDEISDDTKDQADHNRLVWTFVYLADRQISVRMGQSFWSRGPSLSTKFTAKDFSTLRPRSDKDDDYASVLQSTIELTQMLHNVHDVLYSSRARTLAMIFAGDYNRYLDDFQKAAIMWHSTWDGMAVSLRIKNTLLLMFEYLCLYVNAFSFQAVLTRASSRNWASSGDRGWKQPARASLFPRGLMASPDGRYVFDALKSAKRILTVMVESDPIKDLRYLPSRYYLYGVYAGVFLYKAEISGAVTAETEKQETAALVSRFIAVLRDAASSEQHIGRRYGQMLAKLWVRKERTIAKKASSNPQHATSSTPAPERDNTLTKETDPQGMDSQSRRDDNDSSSGPSVEVGAPWSENVPAPELFGTDTAFVDSQLFAPFMPDTFGFQASDQEIFPRDIIFSGDGNWGMPWPDENITSWYQ